MDRPTHPVSHAGDGAERIGARPQMGDGAQEFERVPFFLQRIGFRIGAAVHDNLRRGHFRGLPFALRGFHFAFDR